jgi:branched-chain amino acid aminotransferase
MTVRPVLWVNGTSSSIDQPHIAATDRGMTLSDGLFETMRAHDGVAFRLDRHLARLGGGLDRLSISAPATLRDWVLGALADAHQRASAGAVASVRLTVTRGPGPGGLTPPRDPAPTVIITINPMPAFPASTYEKGLTAVVATGRRNERAESTGLKTLAYTDAVIALLAAQRAGADEALFLDTEGHCSEATASNLFVFTGDALLTPPVSCGALPGITRATVIELAAALGVPTVERAFGVEVLLAAREAFLTSSLRGIAPLVRLDASRLGDGHPGPCTRDIARAYAALVARECRHSQPVRA